jgi:hypothetical protein
MRMARYAPEERVFDSLCGKEEARFRPGLGMTFTNESESWRKWIRMRPKTVNDSEAYMSFHQ